MAEERQITIPGALERVADVCSFVVAAAESVGLDDRGAYHCEMAADEWCTNIIEHGYTRNGEAGLIQVHLSLAPGQLTMTFTDDGPAFDPTELTEPDPTQSLEDREPGGLGWFFIRKIMDAVHYERSNDKNRLTMVKKGVPQPMPDTAPEPESPFPAHTLSNGARVVSPMGRIDSAVSRQFEVALGAQIDAGYSFLIVDLSSATYMSSTGLKTLLTTMRRLQEKGGTMILAALTERVKEVFAMSGFDTVFTISPSVNEAARVLKKG